MRRREVFALLGGAAAWPAALQAQQITAKIGIIIPRSASAAADNVDALKIGLRQLGYIEGENLVARWRFFDQSYDQVPAVVAQMVQEGINLLVVGGTTPAILAKRTTASKPIIFVGVSDPIGSGLIQSLARPGGNATGLATAHEEAYAQKCLEILKELLPSASDVAVLYNPSNPFNLGFVREVRRAADGLNVRTVALEARNSDELARVFSATSPTPPYSLIVATDPFLAARVQEVVAGVNKQRLAAIFGFKEYVKAGGLLSYGANLPDMYRRVAAYVDQVSKGAAPADLPVELPTKFELVINLKTAQAIGLEIPPTLLARADEVIE